MLQSMGSQRIRHDLVTEMRGDRSKTVINAIQETKRANRESEKNKEGCGLDIRNSENLSEVFFSVLLSTNCPYELLQIGWLDMDLDCSPFSVLQNSHLFYMQNTFILSQHSEVSTHFSKNSLKAKISSKYS